MGDFEEGGRVSPRKLWGRDEADDSTAQTAAHGSVQGAPAGAAGAADSGDSGFGNYGNGSGNGYGGGDRGGNAGSQSGAGNGSGQRERSAAAFDMSSLPDLRENAGADAEEAMARNRAEFTTVYDILDSLESQLSEAKGSIFSPNVVKIDRDEFLEQLSELKSKLPVQLERASALMREAEHRLESAQSQANVILSSAQSRASDMVQEAQQQAQVLAGQENVMQIARQKARQLLDDAQAKSDHLTQGADRYCITMMEELNKQLEKFGRDVNSGLTVLKDRQQAAQADLPHLSADDYPKQ